MTLLFFYLAFLSYLTFKGLFTFLPFYFFTFLPFKGLFTFLPFYFFTFQRSFLPLKSRWRTEASIAI